MAVPKKHSITIFAKQLGYQKKQNNYGALGKVPMTLIRTTCNTIRHDIISSLSVTIRVLDRSD